ncbi:hypothetical protein BH09ACT6_BH09ACT6_06860 [soil metagenome]
MRFGTFHLHSIPEWTNPYDVVEQQFSHFLAAEEAGLYEVWLAEHNGRAYGLGGDVSQIAAAIAGATSRIRIGTGVSRLPLHHPVHLAESLAYADVLSKGRLDFGIGKGYDQIEFASYGVPFETRNERWQETLDAIHHMWKTGNTEWNGDIYQFGPATMLPAPLQRPLIPTYLMVANSDESVKYAADKLMPIVFGSGGEVANLRRHVDNYGEHARNAGFDDRAINEIIASFWQMKPVHIGSTTERAKDEYRRGMEFYMSELNHRNFTGFSGGDITSMDDIINHERVIIGSPGNVADRMAEYCEASGINNVIAWINMGAQPNGQVLDAIHRLGEEVQPMLEGVHSTAMKAANPRIVGNYDTLLVGAR